MTSSRLELAKTVFEIEAQSLLSLREKLGEPFLKAVDLILGCRGKLILTGIGKSGHIARKLASTFSSTGTPAIFLHAAESGHGDLGLLVPGDVVIGISYGGESAELFPVLDTVGKRNIPLIAMTAKPGSALGLSAQVVLDISINREACPLGLAPTASSTVSLGLGDALAMVVMQEKKFTAEDFASNHPGGGLGMKLARVRDLMHAKDLPLVKLSTPMRQVLSVMTHRDVRGAVGVCNENDELIGIITDGLIRRKLEGQAFSLDGVASEMMNQNPKTIDSEEMVERARFLMEEFKINQLFVLDSTSPQPKKPVGLLHIQDLIISK